MPERPRDVPWYSKNRKRRNQSQQHCIQETNSYLQVRLVPGRIRRVQRQRLGVEMVSTKKPPLPCFKQLAQTPGSNCLPMGGHPTSRLPKKQDFVLSLTNSTPTEGWLKKSNFSELGESPIQASARIEACRKQATLFMSLGIKCYSQWFAGERNQVSDALFHDDDRL